MLVADKKSENCNNDTAMKIGGVVYDTCYKFGYICNLLVHNIKF